MWIRLSFKYQIWNLLINYINGCWVNRGITFQNGKFGFCVTIYFLQEASYVLRYRFAHQFSAQGIWEGGLNTSWKWESTFYFSIQSYFRLINLVFQCSRLLISPKEYDWYNFSKSTSNFNVISDPPSKINKMTVIYHFLRGM